MTLADFLKLYRLTAAIEYRGEEKARQLLDDYCFGDDGARYHAGKPNFTPPRYDKVYFDAMRTMAEEEE